MKVFGKSGQGKHSRRREGKAYKHAIRRKLRCLQNEGEQELNEGQKIELNGEKISMGGERITCGEVRMPRITSTTGLRCKRVFLLCAHYQCVWCYFLACTVETTDSHIFSHLILSGEL